MTLAREGTNNVHICLYVNINVCVCMHLALPSWAEVELFWPLG